MVRCMPLPLLHDHEHHMNVCIYMIKLVNAGDKKINKNARNYYTGGCNGSAIIHTTIYLAII
jgi:hypothetical protein